jgi:glycosyltransferase involved in cell wall biosynthesis
VAAPISAVICTYNRAEMLRGALRSVVEQTLDHAVYEIVVVSNASTDHTDAVVHEFQEVHPGHEVVLVHEARPGLGHARNRGYKAARGEYVAYLDDDARAAPDWLEQALRCFGEVGPRPAVVGGRILPLYEGEKPGWFKDEYEVRSWGDGPRWLPAGQALSGSNMVWSRSVLEQIGGFGVDVGVKGGILALGEETVAFRKLSRTVDGPAVYYSPRLVVHHWTPRSRMRAIYRLKRAFAFGQASVASGIDPEARSRRAYRVGRLVASIGLRVIRTSWRIVAYRHWRTWLVEEGGQVASRLGALMALLGLRIRVKQR